MPRLPGPEQIARAGLARDPGLRVPTRIPANLAGAAGGMDLGAGLRDIADAVTAEVRRQQQIHDATASEEALLAFEREANDEFQRRSREADTAAPDFASSYNRWLADSAEQRLSGLEGLSEVANARLQTRLQRQALAFERMAQDTQIRAQKARANDVFNQRVNQLGAQASRDPSSMPGLLEEVDSILEGFAPALGPDATRDARTAAREDVLAASVGGLVEAGRYREAEALLASGEFDADLDVAARNSLMTVVERGRRAEAAELNLLVRDHIASIQATGQGIPGLEGRAAGVLEPEEMAQFRADVRLAEDFHAAFEGIRFATPAAMAEQLAVFQPEPGTAGFAQRQRLFETLRSAAEREIAAREEDPAAAAMRMPEVARRFEDAESLEVPLAVRLQAQSNMGIPAGRIRILTDREAEAIVQQVQASEPAARVQQIVELQAAYGRYWPEALGELSAAGLDRVVAVAGGVGLTSPETARQIVLGQQVIAASEGLLPSRATINGWVLNRLEGLFIGRPQAQLDALGSIESLYASLLAGRGELDQTSAVSIDARLMRQAIEGVLGPVVEYNGHKILPPSRAYDDDDFEGLMDGLTDEQIGDALGLDGTRFTAEDIREDAQLITVAPGVYRVRIAGLDLLDAVGSPYVLRLPTPARSAAQSPSDDAPQFGGIPEAQLRPVRRLNPELRQTARPFRSGEFVENEDGTRSTERTITFKIGEDWVNAPSLWMTPDGPVEVTDEDALSRLLSFYEERTGALFQRFGDRVSAIEAARARSDRGGVGS